jgi:hypothetical protein
MPGLKQTIFAGIASAAIVCLPIRPAAAVVPLLFAPWALGHIVAPLIFASAAAPAPAQVPYPAGPGYYGGAPGYYAPPNYYLRPPGYYAPSPGYYPRPYYRPPLSYAPAMPRLPYYSPYGGQASYRSGGGFGYRRR